MQTFEYDPKDEALVASLKWEITKDGYVRSSTKVDGERFLHRILMKPPKGMEVDHRDGNPLNNRRKNLRVVTHKINGFARRMPKRDLPRGVSLHRGKYQASIRVSGRLLYLGRHEKIEDAERAYNKAAMEHFEEIPP